MPDATGEWLVEYVDQDAAREFEHWKTMDEVQARVRSLFNAGFRDVSVYVRVPFEVQIGVTVKAPRKRRKTPSPADKPDPAIPLTGPGNGAAGEPKEGAASPRAVESERAVASAPLRPGPEAASPVFDCEARFEGDPVCPGPVELDGASRGRFCPLHLTAIPLSGRIEFHALHASRNRPVRVAHAG